jgi:hypothetical protein
VNYKTFDIEVYLTDSYRKTIDALRHNYSYDYTSEELNFLRKHRLLNIFIKRNLIERTDNVKKYYFKNNARNLLLLNTINIICLKLTNDNIPHVVLKGVVLSRQAYGDIGSRVCRDIDLLVDGNCLENVHTMLESENFHMREVAQFSNKKYKKYFHHISYWNNDKRVMIELHWRPFSLPYFFLENDYSKISEKIVLDNCKYSVFKNEYNLIYLCIHGALHQFNEMIWVVDIAQFVKTQTINWKFLERKIADWKIDRPIKTGLFLSFFFCNAPVPKSYQQLDKKTEKLVKIVLKQLPNENRNLKNKINKMLYFALLKSEMRYWWSNIIYRIIRVLIYNYK